MKEHPILFSALMVRAILSGQKTQTRRIVKPQPKHTDRWTTLRYFGDGLAIECGSDYPDDEADKRRCPYGKPGDRLWVRETFAHQPAEYEWNVSTSIPRTPAETWYRADFAGGESYNATMPWKPSIHMPRSLSRILLEITDVRVQRLNDISEEDALAEGIDACDCGCGTHYAEGQKWTRYAARDSFRDLWNSINAARGHGWDTNQWVWAITFNRVPQ